MKLHDLLQIYIWKDATLCLRSELTIVCLSSRNNNCFLHASHLILYKSEYFRKLLVWSMTQFWHVLLSPNAACTLFQWYFVVWWSLQLVLSGCFAFQRFIHLHAWNRKFSLITSHIWPRNNGNKKVYSNRFKLFIYPSHLTTNLFLYYTFCKVVCFAFYII